MNCHAKERKHVCNCGLVDECFNGLGLRSRESMILLDIKRSAC
jgi:hypothetical protein